MTRSRHISSHLLTSSRTPRTAISRAKLPQLMTRSRHNSPQLHTTSRTPRTAISRVKSPQLMTRSRHISPQLHTSSHSSRTAVRCGNSTQLVTWSRHSPINHNTHRTHPFYTAQKIHIIWLYHIIWLTGLNIFQLYINYLEIHFSTWHVHVIFFMILYRSIKNRRTSQNTYKSLIDTLSSHVRCFFHHSHQSFHCVIGYLYHMWMITRRYPQM